MANNNKVKNNCELKEATMANNNKVKNNCELKEATMANNNMITNNCELKEAAMADIIMCMEEMEKNSVTKKFGPTDIYSKNLVSILEHLQIQNKMIPNTYPENLFTILSLEKICFLPTAQADEYFRKVIEVAIEAMSELSSRESSVITMIFKDGKTFEEVCETLELGDTCVKRNMRSGLKKIKMAILSVEVPELSFQQSFVLKSVGEPRFIKIKDIVDYSLIDKIINDKFSEESRKLIYLRYQKKMTISKIADEMGYTYDATRHMLTKIHRKLNNILFKKYLQPPKTETSNATNLPFTARTWNVLRREGINSLEELMKLSDSEILSLRNIGQKAKDEIMKYRANK